MLVSPSQSSGSAGSLQSLLQNPTLLQDLIPGVNLSSLASTLQITQQEDEAPLTNLANQQVTLSNQSQAWSQVQSALQAVQKDVQNLSTTAAFDPSSPPVSSNSSVVVAHGAGAAPGTYEVLVQQLATPQVTNSNLVAGSATTSLGYSGTLTLTYDGHAATVSVAASDSLEAIAQNINTAVGSIPGLQLTASVLPTQSGGTAGNVLSLAANTGAGAFSVSASGSGLPLSFSTVSTSHAAEYTVNGVVNDSTVNTIQNALGPGVTLSLLSTSSAPVALTVTGNPAQVASNVGQLVTDVQSAINTLAQVAGQGGPLEGNAALMSVSEQLVNYLTQVNGGLPIQDQSLSDLGLNVSWSQSKGEQVSFSSGTFTQALNTDPSAVQSLFLGSNGSPGIIPALSQYLTSYLGNDGIVAAAQSGITSQETLITNEQTSLQSLVQQEQTNAENQFIAALSTMMKEANLQQTLNAQLGRTSSSSSGSGSTSGG